MFVASAKGRNYRNQRQEAQLSVCGFLILRAIGSAAIALNEKSSLRPQFGKPIVTTNLIPPIYFLGLESEERGEREEEAIARNPAKNVCSK